MTVDEFNADPNHWSRAGHNSCVCRVRRQTLLKLPDIQFKTSFNPSVSESMWVEAGRAATIDETNFIMTIDI